MLLRFKIKNFLSFHKETEFDMFPNIKREKFQHHIYTDMEAPLLKQAVIYGANGSGKSNFIKAVAFLREFVTHNNFLENIDLDDYIFQLTQNKQPIISFEIEFFYKEKYYIYDVNIGKNEVSEKLSISGLYKREDKLIFERNGTEIKSDYLQNAASSEQLLKLRPLSSILFLNTNFPVIINNDVKEVYDWFSKQLNIIMVNSTLPMLINIMSQQSKLLKFANEIFENTGIGINSLKIENTPFEKWIANPKNANIFQSILVQGKEPDFIYTMENNRNIFNVSVQKGIKTVQEFLFSQSGQSGYHKEMKISAQSEGTVRLLTLIPALFYAMYQNKTIFIDEIDNSIHPNLIFELIRFYTNNTSNGQLIFTTHTTKLLNQQELFRPDEIWLTEKSEGNTKMYSLNEFKLHNTLNIENGYLDGRYGAVPVIEELNINL
jgi:AAA15 family ATPase/GTPase